jgi:hypothetical protein
VGERRDVSPIARQFVILGGTRGIKFNAFSSQNWQQGCHLMSGVVQHVDREWSFNKIAVDAAI